MPMRINGEYFNGLEVCSEGGWQTERGMNSKPEYKLPEWKCEKELPCGCSREVQVHRQDWKGGREYVWVCGRCGHRKEWN